MTIKEIEILTSMERGNIRFYEREGLINPQRMDNGYRNYSDTDLQILLRIKLLRSLHISLDEIKELKDGNYKLSEVLIKQIKVLEQEKQDCLYAQDVCRSINEEQLNFATLDAAKYLDKIRQAAEKSNSQYFTVKGDMLPQVFHPWRRFLARAIDFFIYQIIWSIFLAFILQINLSARSSLGNLLDSFIAVMIMLFLEPLWLHFLGTTPGKAIWGLKIENADGKHLSYKEGLERTWNVIGSGLGYNIPIYNLIRLWKSYKICSESEIQPWDVSISYSIKDTKKYRNMVYVGAYAAAFAALILILSAQMLPPQRGDLTISQFAKNYNYYAKYLGVDFGNQYLDENGKWVKKETDEMIYIEYSYSETPEYNFELENGYIKEVSFDVQIRNNQDYLGSYDTLMILSSLAFVGAQDEMKLLSRIPNRIINQIENNSFQDFQFTEADILFSCDTDYSGYTNLDLGFLLPEENIKENYFSISFSMIK